MFHRRRDAKLIKGLSQINQMFPYIMREKIGSQVYVPMKLYMDKAVEYVQAKAVEKGRREFSYFDVLVVALMRSIAQKPQLNRFIKGRHYYQRNDLSATFIVKRKLTESDDERQAIIKFDPGDTFDTAVGRLRTAIDEMRHAPEDNEEKIMKVLLAFPTWFVNAFTKVIYKMDDWGGMPKFLAESDGMHTSVYIANLGSIGFDDAPFHHLYEWGTGSIFLTFGRLHKERIISKDGSEKVRHVINAAVTIDERISEGIYYANALRLFRKYVQNPVLLEEKPDIPHLWEKMRAKGKVLRLGT